MTTLNRLGIEQELTFKAVRSGGPGGQHVNKVSTKVIATFNVQASECLCDDEKAIILEKLATHITKEGEISIGRDTTRSQKKNKEEAVDAIIKLLESAFIKPKPRKKTAVPKAVIAARIKEKRLRGEKKQNRKGDFGDY